MWSLLAPFLIGRATGGWRFIRVLLFLTLIGCIIGGIVYAALVIHAVQNQPESHHVQHHSSH